MRENIVIPAWQTVIQGTTIKKFNFFPAFLGTFWLSLIVLYQITFTYVQFFDKKDEFFSMLDNFIHKSYFNETIIAVGCILLLYMIIAPIAEAGMVIMIDNESKWEEKQPISGISWFFRGCTYFLPLFELQNLLSVFKLISIITFYILLLRIFWKDYFWYISAWMGIYLLFAFMMNMFFAYAPYFVIFEWKKAFEALSASTHMAIHNIEVTFHLYFTLLLVYLRTIVLALIFIILPFIVSGILAVITILGIKIAFLVITAVFVFLLLIFMSHLNSVLEIFVNSIWYQAYKENKKLDTSFHVHSVAWHHDEEHHDDHHH